MERINSHTGRNSNIELLRVLCMIMIVGNHYASFGFFSEDIMYTGNKYIVDLMFMPGKVAVELFVIISGYYMVDQSFRLQKLINMMGQVWFYTLSALIGFVLIAGPDMLSMNLVKISVLPLISSHYWFVSYYVILLVLSPFINAMLGQLTKAQHGFLAVFLFTLCTVLPEYFGIKFAEGYLWLFVSLYISAAYLKMHLSKSEKKARIFSVAAILLLVLSSLKIVLTIREAQLAGDSAVLENTASFIWTYSPLAFVTAILLFLAFACYRPRYNKTIAKLGSLTFGVYLFHTNQIVNTYIWQKVFNTSAYASSRWLIVHAAITVAMVYGFGCLAELLRQRFFAPLWNRFVERIVLFIEQKSGWAKAVLGENK